MREKYHRKSRGGTIAEMPAAMWLVFMGLLIPFIGLMTFGYRVSLAYFGVRDAALQAAKTTSYTNASAKALAVWGADNNAWTGVTGTQLTTYAVIHPLSGAAETAQASPLTTVDTNLNLYFVRVTAISSVKPVVTNGYNWWGVSVPGFNAPISLSNTYQVYFENPQGLKL